MRVSDPSSCTNAAECAIYCSGDFESVSRCADYARTGMSVISTSSPSLTDGIPSERLGMLLSDRIARAREIPDIVTSVDDLRLF